MTCTASTIAYHPGVGWMLRSTRQGGVRGLISTGHEHEAAVEELDELKMAIAVAKQDGDEEKVRILGALAADLFEQIVAYETRRDETWERNIADSQGLIPEQENRDSRWRHLLRSRVGL
jgi:hypothetical protein